MWHDRRHFRISGSASLSSGHSGGDNLVDENSVRISDDCHTQSSGLRRLEVMTHNVDGIECEVTRLLFEEGIALDCADTIHDGDYVFMCLKVVAPHYTEEMWKRTRDKLLRMVRLSNFQGLGQKLETGKMYKIAVEVPPLKEGSLRHVWEVLHDRGLQVVQTAAHEAGDSLTEGHPVLSFADRCDLCDSHSDDGQDEQELGADAVESDNCHLHFSVCDLLQLLPPKNAAQSLENLVKGRCAAVGLEPCKVSASVLFDAETHTQKGVTGPKLATPTPYLCWQRPNAGTWGASKCPLSHFGRCSDGRRRFVSHAVPASVTKDTDIFVDDTMGGSTCTCVEIECVDRKGLVLDIFWAVHSLGVSLVQSRISGGSKVSSSGPRGKKCMQLFLRDRSSGPLMEEARLRFVLEQLLRAITLPVSITVIPGVGDSLEVLVFGLLGPGSRGRPRVTADVTKIIQQESLKVLAAFVGIVDDQAVQDRLPGEALHEMADNLLFPLLQRRNAVTALPAWDDVGADDTLTMHTARETCSNCSPRVPVLHDELQHGTKIPSLSTLETSAQTSYNCLQPSSCDSSSSGTSLSPRVIPMLRDLGQHAYCPFLEDDAPLACTQTPASLSFMRKSSLPRGLLSTGLQTHKSVPSSSLQGAIDSQRKKQPSGRVPVDSMLSFFGEESIPHSASHSPTGCRHLVELHHFVCRHTAQDAVAIATRLKHLLEQSLCTLSCHESLSVSAVA